MRPSSSAPFSGAVSAIATVLALLTVACSSGPSAPSATVQADVELLQEVLGNDPARAVLHDVDQAIDDERPVMAAELIDHAALPAIGRHIESFERAQVTTMEGRRFRTRAVRVHRARRDAVARYGHALSRGIGTEDDELLAALDAYGDAEREILALHDDLAEVRPLAPEALERMVSEREATLGGHPQLRRAGAPGEDPDGEPAPPEGAPDDSLGEPTEPMPEE